MLIFLRLLQVHLLCSIPYKRYLQTATASAIASIISRNNQPACFVGWVLFHPTGRFACAVCCINRYPQSLLYRSPNTRELWVLQAICQRSKAWSTALLTKVANCHSAPICMIFSEWASTHRELPKYGFADKNWQIINNPQFGKSRGLRRWWARVKLPSGFYW